MLKQQSKHRRASLQREAGRDFLGYQKGIEHKRKLDKLVP